MSRKVWGTTPADARIEGMKRWMALRMTDLKKMDYEENKNEENR